MADPVKRPRAPRTRRADRAEQTRRRIIDAASALFADPGYAAATIEAVAARADVAVETVYSRFRTKSNLLVAILEPAVTGTDDGRDLLDLPEIAEVRGSGDQQHQVRLLARFSRTVLGRAAHAQRILHRAAATDAAAAELLRQDRQRRLGIQTAYVDMLLANGPLRDGLTRAEAADTYATLANPTTYAFLTEDRGWTAHRYEDWLRDSLTLLLLPG